MSSCWGSWTVWVGPAPHSLWLHLCGCQPPQPVSASHNNMSNCCSVTAVAWPCLLCQDVWVRGPPPWSLYQSCGAEEHPLHAPQGIIHFNTTASTPHQTESYHRRCCGWSFSILCSSSRCTARHLPPSSLDRLLSQCCLIPVQSGSRILLWDGGVVCAETPVPSGRGLEEAPESMRRKIRAKKQTSQRIIWFSFWFSVGTDPFTSLQGVINQVH